MMLTRTAQVVTLAGDALIFLSMTGTESLGRPFEYDLELLSEDEALDLSAQLGKPMLVVLELPDGFIREFSGYVTRFVLAGEMGRYVRYRVTLRPWLWLMTRRSNCRIFQNQSVPDVLKAMFREYGFTDFEDSGLTGEYRTWEYLVQYRESDFNFVSRIMEQEGIYYFFRHEDGKHTLVLADGYSAHERRPGYGVVPYIPKTRDHVIEDHVDSWRVVQQITSGAFTSDDYDFERPKAKLAATLKPGAGYDGGDYELFDYPGEYADADQGTVQVKLRLEAEQVPHDLSHGAGNARGICCGALMELSEFPRLDQNKEYLILSTNLSIRIEDHESKIDAMDFSAAPTFRCEFTASDAKRPFRVARSTPKPVVRGPQTAVVVGQSGQEIWTDKYGRVKVQFRWDRYGEADENSSCWVRVAQLWAGQGWGGIHIPRMGQEVIVDFLEGNPDRPVITGRLYNADNMPPYELPTNQTQSGIKSRSTKGGTQDNFNEIRFEDKKGEEELFMQAEKNMTVNVKNDQSTSVKASRSAGVGGGDSVSVGGDRSLSVTGKLSETVKGGESKHEVTGKFILTASDTISLTATNKITLTVGGSTISMDKNRIVIHAGKGTEIAMDQNGRFESSQHSLMFLDANACVTSSQGSQMLLDPHVAISSTKSDGILLDGNATMSTPGDATVDGATVACVGKTEASISASSSLTLSPASADLSGAQVNVAGQGVVSISGPMVKIG